METFKVGDIVQEPLEGELLREGVKLIQLHTGSVLTYEPGGWKWGMNVGPSTKVRGEYLIIDLPPREFAVGDVVEPRDRGLLPRGAVVADALSGDIGWVVDDDATVEWQSGVKRWPSEAKATVKIKFLP
jgi:hypothetical protein